MALMSVDAQTPAVPRLVVNILVDQLRTDYLEAFAPLYGEGGLKRLLSEARYYTDAAPAFRKPDRASAAASLVTGTVPYDNGITGLTWLSRKTLQPVFCVDDSRFTGIQTQDRTSPRKRRNGIFHRFRLQPEILAQGIRLRGGKRGRAPSHGRPARKRDLGGLRRAKHRVVKAP